MRRDPGHSRQDGKSTGCMVSGVFGQRPAVLAPAVLVPAFPAKEAWAEVSCALLTIPRNHLAGCHIHSENSGRRRRGPGFGSEPTFKPGQTLHCGFRFADMHGLRSIFICQMTAERTFQPFGFCSRMARPLLTNGRRLRFPTSAKITQGGHRTFAPVQRQPRRGLAAATMPRDSPLEHSNDRVDPGADTFVPSGPRSLRAESGLRRAPRQSVSRNGAGAPATVARQSFPHN